jgi:hypothetical protein
MTTPLEHSHPPTHHQTTSTRIPPGIRKSCDVWYRALTSYFTPVTDYLEARQSTLMAARDLYPGSTAEADAVAAAWDLVGAPTEADKPGPKCDASFATDYGSCGV